MRRDSFTDFLLDQMRSLGDVRARAMFGGHGLYQGNVFFGIVYGGRVYFKTDKKTAAKYERCGMSPFRPRPGQGLKRYYEVPVDVIEDDNELVAWAREAIKSG